MTSTEIAVADATTAAPPAASSAGDVSPDPDQRQSPNGLDQRQSPNGLDQRQSPNGLDQRQSPIGTRLGRTPRRRHVLGMLAWGALFVTAWLTIGIPTDPIEAFLWIWAATIAWNNDRPWRTHLLFVRDWAVVIVLLVIYNISRGWASTASPHVTEMVHADAWMFGWLTGGKIPTVWLQEHLYHYQHVRWFEVVASSVYFSHFVMALIVAAVLWMRNRDRWLSFVRRWFALTGLILTTYFLYPAAPPWWASQNGELQDVVSRLSTRGWDAIGLHHAGSLLNAAQVQEANPVAAMPSMHSAYALMIVVFFLPMVRKRWWPLLLCYPLAMTFALVYSGEHYMVDVFAGWLYVGVTFAVVWAGERLWAAFRAGRGSAMALVRPVTVAPVTVAEPAIQVAQRAEAAAAERDAWRTSERPRVAQEAAPVEEFG